MPKPLQIVDLFCGAGGTSTGILKASATLGLDVELTAVNHWTTAINSHSLNHPGVRHICEPVENLWPARVIPGRHLKLLAASCECTFHGNARGGGPLNEQSRSQPWQIVRWATDIEIDTILMENVPEFQNWCPLLKRAIYYKGKLYKKRRPDPRRKGEYFRAFIQSLEAIGYKVEFKIQNAADYGDATNRRRLILLARKNGPIMWPEPSHGPGRNQPHRTARQIIDWTLKGKSIFARKKPLCANTMRRIESGLRKFGGANAEPFLVILRGTSEGHCAASVRSVDEPIDPVTTSAAHHGLCEPFLTHLTHHGERRPHSVDEPMPTVTGAHRGEMALVEPFISSFHAGGRGDHRNHSPDEPLPTQDTSNRFALVQPIIVRTDQTGSNGHCTQPIDVPLTTVVSKQNMGLVEPFVVKYYGTGCAKDLNRPLDTVTTRDRFMLVEPETGRAVAELDIRFRMLQPGELAAAHSFPSHYKFTGTKGDQTTQIGNSVPIELANAHARALL